MFEESPAKAWELRYGCEAPEDLPDLGSLLCHRSVRQFAREELSEGVARGLVAAAQSAATSSNLQLWTVVSVQDPQKRGAIATLAGDQQQVRDAPWFIVFLADLNRLRRVGLAVGEPCAGLDYEEFKVMAVVDASLAAERMVCAAEALGLGICYVGAVRNDVAAMRELLGLPEGVAPLFGLCVGRPASSCAAAIKPRLRQQAVWHRERYEADVDEAVAEYDARMKGFYESQKMKGEVTWSMRCGRRVDGRHMTGREALKRFLEEQGFGRR